MDTTPCFSLGAILTVLSGRYVASQLDEVYRLLQHLTGSETSTQHIPRAMTACQPWLAAAFPALALQVPALITVCLARPDTITAHMQALAAHYGDTLPMPVMPPGFSVPMDPLEERVTLLRSNVTSDTGPGGTD